MGRREIMLYLNDEGAAPLGSKSIWEAITPPTILLHVTEVDTMLLQLTQNLTLKNGATLVVLYDDAAFSFLCWRQVQKIADCAANIPTYCTRRCIPPKNCLVRTVQILS